MSSINKKQGNKASNEKKIKNLNKSKTFSTIENLCKLYLGRESEIYADVKSEDMYIMFSDLKKQAIDKFKTVPDDPVIFINTLELYNRYFRSREGANRQYKIIRWRPELSEQKTTVFFFVWFFNTNKIYGVDYLKVSKFTVDEFEMVAFSAFL